MLSTFDAHQQFHSSPHDRTTYLRPQKHPQPRSWPRPPSPSISTTSLVHEIPAKKGLITKQLTASLTPAPSAPIATIDPTGSTTGQPSHSASAPISTSASTGTQYTPPDWPPTSTRSSQHASRFSASQFDGISEEAGANVLKRCAHDDITNSTPQQPGQQQSDASMPTALVADGGAPPEPQLGMTPGSTLLSKPPSGGMRRRPASLEGDRNVAGALSVASQQASPKRRRGYGAAKKVLPVEFSRCDTTDLAVLIADMLMELISYNDNIPLKEAALTRFHSRSPPNISVRDYLLRLTLHATLSAPILLSMVFYIDRLCLLYPAFTINSLTVHRFLITAATVAAKGLSDSFWTNALYSRVGGIGLRELFLLELDLLFRVEWRIVPTPECLSDYYASLVQRSEEFEIDDSNELLSEGEDEANDSGADDMDTRDAP